MKTSTIIWTVVALLIIIGSIVAITRSTVKEQTQTFQQTQQAQPAPPQQLTTTTMQLTSTAFEPNGSIPSRYTCDGNDVSPPLAISDVPDGAQSLVLIMDDPDAPAGTWDHWVIFNIPPTTADIPEGTEPQGVHGVGTGNNTTYKGPCPPDREHRYFFKLYALDTVLDLAEGATKADVEQAMQGHILDQTELIGRYERQ